MAVEIPQEKKFNWTIVIVVVIVLLAAYFAYTLFFTSGSSVSIKPEESVPPLTLRVNDLQLNIDSILSNTVFGTLKSHINPITVPQQIGRPNPFMPY